MRSFASARAGSSGSRPVSPSASRSWARAWAAPVHVGAMLLEQVYSRKASIVFTSATLSVSGSTAFLKQRLGLDLIEPEPD